MVINTLQPWTYCTYMDPVLMPPIEICKNLLKPTLFFTENFQQSFPSNLKFKILRKNYCINLYKIHVWIICLQYFFTAIRSSFFSFFGSELNKREKFLFWFMWTNIMLMSKVETLSNFFHVGFFYLGAWLWILMKQEWLRLDSNIEPVLKSSTKKKLKKKS